MIRELPLQAGGVDIRDNKRQSYDVLKTALGQPTSRYLCGYWQGNKPPDLIWEA